MDHQPETRRSLLVRIRDPVDTVAWDDFVSIYTPLLYDYARRRGLQDADAADLSQTVLISIARSISGFEYDPTKGKFRGWLLTIARNEVSKMLQRRNRTPLAMNEASLEGAIDGRAIAADEDLWNREHEQHLFNWAVERVRGEFQRKTWQAFWTVAVEGASVASTAEALGMTAGAIYIAKSRVTARLRQMISSVEAG